MKLKSKLTQIHSNYVNQTAPKKEKMSEAPPKSRLTYCKDILQQRLSDAITALTPRRRFSCLPIRVPASQKIIEYVFIFLISVVLCF